jgi:hypothetical protein
MDQQKFEKIMMSKNLKDLECLKTEKEQKITKLESSNLDLEEKYDIELQNSQLFQEGIQTPTFPFSISPFVYLYLYIKDV